MPKSLTRHFVLPPSRKGYGGQDLGELSRAAVLVLEFLGHAERSAKASSSSNPAETVRAAPLANGSQPTLFAFAL